VTSRGTTEMATALLEVPAPAVVHGYPPPAQPAGAIVVAYCGAPMVVRGEFSAEPPRDTCAECVTIWERERHAAPRGTR
jgi:hypothetical protein